MNYEYRSFSLSFRGQDRFIDLVNGLGRDNWEVIGTTTMRVGDQEVHVDARRVPHGADAPWSWEYHLFGTSPAPAGWIEHLGGCGWIKLEPPYFSYGGVQRYLFKRPGTWSGRDDGDVMARLTDLGWDGGDHFQVAGALPGGYNGLELNTIAAILRLKWELSEKGADVGTYRAVRAWLIRDYLPLLLAAVGAARVEDLIPHAADLPEDAVLDLLLGRRAASAKNAHIPTLLQVVVELAPAPLARR